jgi:Putative transposase
MRRFLQHVLPKGLHKVRYYGLWHASRREHAAQARLLLELQRPTAPRPEAPPSEASRDTADRPPAPTAERRACPCCKQGYLTRIGRLHPKQASGP